MRHLPAVLAFAILTLAACASERVGSAVQADGTGGSAGSGGAPALGPCPPPREVDVCDPACASDEWCYAGACYPIQGFEDPTGCGLGRDDSCDVGLYCSYASGECEPLPRADCSP